jgi:hypothetical protein
MAKTKSSEVRAFTRKSKKRLGRHAKRKTANKRSKNYKKAYQGQGR